MRSTRFFGKLFSLISLSIGFCLLFSWMIIGKQPLIPAVAAANQTGRPVAAMAQALPYTFAPVKSGTYSSPFGHRVDPITGEQSRLHTGMDIAAETGTPIIVPQAGLVVFSGTQSGYGEVVVVQHHPMFHTLYAHASKRLVKRGQVVQPGDIIALVGSTGRVTGPHLHFETILNERYTNPLDYLTFLENSPPIAKQAYAGRVALAMGVLPAQKQPSVIKEPVQRIAQHTAQTIIQTQAAHHLPLPLPQSVTTPTVPVINKLKQLPIVIQGNHRTVPPVPFG